MIRIIRMIVPIDIWPSPQAVLTSGGATNSDSESSGVRCTYRQLFFRAAGTNHPSNARYAGYIESCGPWGSEGVRALPETSARTKAVSPRSAHPRSAYPLLDQRRDQQSPDRTDWL